MLILQKNNTQAMLSYLYPSKIMLLKSFSEIELGREGKEIIKGTGWPKGTRTQGREKRKRTLRKLIAKLPSFFIIKTRKDHHL